MHIEIHRYDRMTLKDFAETHNLTMEIHERGQGHLDRMRYFAHFKNCEIKEGIFLNGEYGNGTTHDEAMSDYASRISGRLLVFNAMSKEKRSEIHAPILTHEFDKE